MIRSLRRREKMSQPRSPRWVCSMTVGMMKFEIGGGGTSRMAGSFRAGGGLLLGFVLRAGFAPRLLGRDDQRPFGRRGRIFVGDLSLGDQHIKRLLFTDLGFDLLNPAVLFEVGAQLLHADV